MSSRVKEYVNGVLEKVKISLAISIIRNTPPGKTASEYTKDLSEALNKQWHDDDDPFEERNVGRLLVERVHLKNQQSAVARQLSSLIPSSKNSYLCTSNTLDSGYSSCEISEGVNTEPSSLFSDYEKTLDFTEDVRETLGANLDFIRGVVRLKALLGDDEVLGETFDNVMREVKGPTLAPVQDSESTTGVQLSANQSNCADTQNTGVVCTSGKSNYTVASAVVQYTLQTTGAEMIVKKSVQEIHRHLCVIALDSTDLANTISNWEGSLLQHSAAVIRRLANEKNFQKIIMISTGGLATIIITEMIRNYGLEKNIKLENQITLLLQLCENSVTCAEVIKIVTDTINLILARYRVLYQSESSSTPTERTIFCENTYYIFYLTERLLSRYFKMQQNSHSLPEHHLTKKKEERKITDLWRGAWEKNSGCKPLQNEPSNNIRESQDLLKSWSTSLENAAKAFSLSYPLLTMYANNCIEIINGNQKKVK